MASASQSIAMRTRSHTIPQAVQFTEPQNADLVLRLESVENKPSMLLHTSMATVKNNFKNIEIGDREYTENDLLSLTEPNTAAFVLLMKMAHENPVTEEDVDGEDKSVDDKGLRRVAEMAAKYKYEGPVPAWIAERLKKQLHFDDALFPASRQLTWLLRPIDFAWFEERHPLYDINKMDFVKQLYDAHIELRKTLFANLPPVLYPDPHGNGLGGCRKCNAVPHFRRWCEELLASEDFFFFLDALPLNAEYSESCTSLYSTFNIIFLTMLHEFKRDQDDNADKPLPCGRFRVRMSYLRELDDPEDSVEEEEDDGEEEHQEGENVETASGEISDAGVPREEPEDIEDELTEAEEGDGGLDESWKDEWRQVQLMEDVYDSIGGLCLKCFKQGNCKYQHYCKKHEVLLGL